MHRKVYAATKALRSVGQSRIRRSNNKKLITSFAERCNMVYFGFVSQMSDEHRIVRGLTVSTKHQDHHYCIGSYRGYDVVFVERTDTLLTSGHKHTWHILEFDLNTTVDLPHIFIGSSTHGNGFHSLLNAKYSAMIAAPLEHDTSYPSSFTSYFSLYVKPSQMMKSELLIDPGTAEMIGKHFKGLVVEIHESSLYIYSEKAHLSAHLLDTMIANGTWLARHIDEKSQLL